MTRFNFTHSAHKKQIYLLVFFYVIFFISFVIFIIKPTLFYYRSWEYFDEIGFHIPHKLRWEGGEKGDLSRFYIYSFQNQWATTVSTDEEGYRSIPLQAEKFPIVIFGDSHTWGTGLSDEETIPWQVALQIGAPVFNGGKFPFTLAKMIHNPRIKESKIIIELVAQHLISRDIFAHDDFESTTYETYAGNKAWKNYFAVHPKRYFLPLKMLRKFSTHKGFISEIRKNTLDSSLIPLRQKQTGELKDEDLECAIQNICKRAEKLKALGYLYIIAFIPAKNLQLTYVVDPIDIKQEQQIAEALRKNHVDYLDLCSLFRNAQPRTLFIPTDNHINSRGAALIAKTIADHLTKRYPDIVLDAKLTSSKTGMER